MKQSQKSNPSRMEFKKIKKEAQYDIMRYRDQAIQMLKNNKRSSELDFKENDFNDFVLFFENYERETIFKKEQLIEKCRKASQFQDLNDDKALLFQLRVADSALYHDKSQHHRLRKTQLMAIYLYLKNPNRVKILMQILTGEGKTTIIACLAAVLYMRGLNVDIVTTNQMLAKRDQSEKENFFHLLGIPVGNNILPKNGKTEKERTHPRQCYANRGVVYGIPSSYQADILFDEYQQKGTRNKRSFDVIIIDEVDLMFIDNKSSQTLLSTRYNGYSELVTPMKIVWRQIITNTIIQQNQKLFLYLQGRKKGEIMKGEVNQVMKVIVQVIKDKFKNQLIQDEKKQFVRLSLQSWIQNAIKAAHHLEEDQDYVIHNRQIIPIDKSTGAHLKNVSWSNGLHQFLQIKHGLPVYPESMTSNFISNIGHFARYKMILGLTGTLGSQSSRQFLKKTYETVIVEIPPTFKRKLIIDPGYFMFDYKRWMEKILERCKKMINLSRSVLIVCQDIRTVQIVKEKIQKTFGKQIHLHIYRTGQQNRTDKIDFKQIIIATNIAGRGMDFKPTQELNQKGGLHVIVTYMPENLRVQMQARGRSGRNGAPGSSELIVNHLEYFKECNLPFYDAQTFQGQKLQDCIQNIQTYIRDQRQSQRMKRDTKRVNRIRIRDEKFSKFCTTLNSIPDIKKNNPKRVAIQEAWSIFLKQKQTQGLSDKQFGQDADNIIQKFAQNSDSFYRLSHNFERGYNKAYSMKKEDRDQASKLFKQLQEEKNSSMQQYSGLVGEIFVKGRGIDRQIETNVLKQQLKNLLIKSLEKTSIRKEIIKADSLIANSVGSRIAVMLMKGQSQRRKKELNQAIERTQVHAKISKVGISRLERQKQIQQRIQQQSQIENMFKNPQQQFIQTIQKHIQKQLESLKSLKQGQTISVTLENLRNIIDKENIEENSEQQAALERLQTQTPLQPVVKILKKEDQIWKRVLIFALGVAQIYVGAFIIFDSVGISAILSEFMIREGIKDCFNALFLPEICKDLQKYFTQKTISYTAKMAQMRLEGIDMIKHLGLKQFKFFQNSSTQLIIKESYQALQRAFMNCEFDWKKIAKDTIYKGMNYYIRSNEKSQETLNVKQVTKRLIDHESKNLIKQFMEQEDQIYKQELRSCKKFSTVLSPKISEIINSSFEKHFKFYQLYQLDDEISRKIIDMIFKVTKSPLLNFQMCEQIRMDIEKFFIQDIDDGVDIINEFIKRFALKQQIDEVFKQLQQSDLTEQIKQYFQELAKKELQELFNTLREEVNKRNQQLKKQFEKIETDHLYSKRDRLNTYKMKTNKLYDQVKELKQFNQNIFYPFISQPGLLKRLLQMSIFADKFQPKDQYHPFLQDILIKFHRQHKSSNFNKKLFIELFQIQIYNRFTVKILKIISKQYNNFSRRADIVTVIQEKVLKEIKGDSNGNDPFK